VIFAMAFPMRHRWQNGLMLLGAPLIGMGANGMRITMRLIRDLVVWLHGSEAEPGG
jgi:hypothetical protein